MSQNIWGFPSNQSTTFQEALGYKKYVALLTQEVGNAPIAIVLENTLAGTPVWTYNSTGNYSCTLAGAFPEGKTYCTATNGFDWPTFGQINFGRGPTGDIDNLIMYYTDPGSGWGAVDINCFPAYDVYVEIRVYP